MSALRSVRLVAVRCGDGLVGLGVTYGDGLVGLGVTYGDAPHLAPLRRTAAAITGLDVVKRVPRW